MIDYAFYGINDDLFIRGKVPMTKSEVRAITISKLKLTKESRVLDIGAGTGSISIECGFICNQGRIYSVERNKEGIELINKNIDRFRLKNVEIIHGTAPEVFDNIKNINRVIVGGSGGKLEDIFEWFRDNLDKESIVVANFITIENLYKAIKLFKKYKYKDIEVVQASISKSKDIGNLTMLMGNNPVFIITGKK